jgi:hypothetical protein
MTLPLVNVSEFFNPVDWTDSDVLNLTSGVMYAPANVVGDGSADDTAGPMGSTRYNGD